MKTNRINRNELDGIVVNIELTLSSIIQGVALYFLTENAHTVLADRWQAWPYVGVGLLILLLFWSRSLIHTLTLIRWPIEFVHNFFYIGCTLVEALAFTRLSDPFWWFVLNAIFSALVWGLFVYDLRLIRLRQADSAGAEGDRLYAMVRRDQYLNIRLLVPAIFVFNVAAATMIHLHGGFFLAQGGHVLLILLQGTGFLMYLGYVIRTFARLHPLIAATREEWRLAGSTSNSSGWE
jgi:hypothetical protein